jgi:hypothetical protein
MDGGDNWENTIRTATHTKRFKKVTAEITQGHL